jgi:hypothetical protein
MTFQFYMSQLHNQSDVINNASKSSSGYAFLGSLSSAATNKISLNCCRIIQGTKESKATVAFAGIFDDSTSPM